MLNLPLTESNWSVILTTAEAWLGAATSPLMSGGGPDGVGERERCRLISSENSWRGGGAGVWGMAVAIEEEGPGRGPSGLSSVIGSHDCAERESAQEYVLYH